MNPIRISKTNAAEITKLIADSKNDLLTPSIAVNAAVEKGLPAVRKLYVKPAKK